jgi:hypothetical protein
LGCTAEFPPGHQRQGYCAGCRASCSVDGCEAPGQKRGLCFRHYARFRRTGEVGTAEFQQSARAGSGRKPMTPPKFDCEKCGKTTIRTQNLLSHAYDYTQRFCSKGCADAALFKGGYVHRGYRVLTVAGVPVPEHRLVMEQSLGRKLLDRETVHHRDGNRLNNAIENLELWSNRHSKGQRVDEKIAHYKSFLQEHGVDVPHFQVSDYLSGILAIGA